MRNIVHLDQEVSPDTVEDLEGDKKSVENIVGREELNVSCSIIEGGVEDMGWVYSTPKSRRNILGLIKSHFIFAFLDTLHLHVLI